MGTGLARIIHERSVFVNNAPAGAASAAPAGFDPAAAAACSRLALSDAPQMRAESKPGGQIIHFYVNNRG